MAQIRSKNTTPEMNVRRATHALRFRLHGADLPGKPDLLFCRWRTALFRERLLLTFAPLRQSATSENQRRLLDEQASAEHGPGQGDHQAPEEVRLAMRGHLGVPGEGSRQIGQDSSPPVRFGSPALIAAVGLEGRCRPVPVGNQIRTYS
jgi:hypothetical protein